MTERESLGLWSTTAATNASADPNIGWAEGQLPSTVNNSARAMMAAVARFKKDIDGSLTTAGSANAYTLTVNNTWTAYANGQVISFKASFANTGAATLNVTNADAAALGAKAIRGPGDVALLSGQMVSGGRYFLQYDTAANSAAGAWIVVNPTQNVREVLTASRAYYVGASSTVTVTIASPGVVTWTGHGLSANASVVLSFLPFRLAVTMTIASPGVVTWTAHGFSAGQPIVFTTTNGALPTGVTAGTTYFVIATGLTTNTFQFSATVGGSAINTSGSQSGTHFGSKTGALPTGLSINTQYFVKTVVDANTFTLSATANGSVINTTGSQSGTITAVSGSDSNTGLTQTTTGAFLTAQKAFDTALKTIDRAGYTITIQLADGTTLGNISMVGPGAGDGSVVLQGNVTYPDNAFLLSSTASTDALSLVYGAKLTVGGVKFQAAATGNCMAASYDCDLAYSLCTFSTCALHVHPDFGSRVIQTGVNTVVGAANSWLHVTNASYFQAAGGTLFITGTPNFPSFFVGGSENSNVIFTSLTFTGTATTTSGSRYFFHQGVTVETASATFDLETYFPGSTVGIQNGKGTYNDFFARIDMGAIAAPATPGAGTSFAYIDSTAKALRNKDDAGTVHTTVPVGSNLFASVFFGVSGGVCTILNSYNVTSVSYTAAGQYVVHFTTSSTGTNNYGAACMPQNGAANAYALEDAGRSTSAFPIVVVARGSGSTTDVGGVNCIFFGT